jgi:hypothetical protein
MPTFEPLPAAELAKIPPALRLQSVVAAAAGRTTAVGETADAADKPQRLVVNAKVVKTSPPDVQELYPDTVNYTLWEIQEVLEGEYAGKQLLTLEWSQKDLNFLKPFQYEVGHEMTLEVIPLDSALRQDRLIRQADLMDAVRRPDLPTFWIVEHHDL